MAEHAGAGGTAPLEADVQVSHRPLRGDPDDGRYRLDDAGRFVSVDDRMLELTGRSREALLDAHVSTVLDDDDVSVAESTIRAALEYDLETATLTLDLHRPDGDCVPCRVRFAPLRSDGEFRGTVGVVRGLSERNVESSREGDDRREHEAELQRRQRQQEVLADLGQFALEADDLDQLLAESVRVVADTLDTDYCGVLELDRRNQRLALREGVGWRPGAVGSGTVGADEGSLAAFALDAEEPVVVDDLEAETRFDASDLLASHDVESGVSVTVGAAADPWGVLGAHDAERHSFSVDDVNFVQGIANVLTTAIDRMEREREIRRQRERLEALNSLHGLVHRVTEAAIEQPTREKVEEAVCTYLSEADSYRFAWIGDVDAGDQTVTPRCSAGTDGYLDEVEVTIDPDDEMSGGPTGRAYLTGKVQTCRHVRSDPRYEPWRAQAHSYGFESSAAVPITHENTVFGVLNVYAERPDAFAGQEREMIEYLGEIVGHAIAAVERKQALLDDELLEVEFRIRDVLDAYDVPEPDGRIAFDRIVPVAAEEYLVYGTAAAAARETLEALVDGAAHWTSVTFSDEGEECSFEVRTSDSPLVATVASNGGRVERAFVEDGNLNVTARLPMGTDVRRVVDAVSEAYPDVELLARRQVDRPEAADDAPVCSLPASLTDRQRTALETAYHAGFFEWPREHSGEELAERLDITPATFTQHLRTAERKLLEELLEDQSTAG